MSYIARLATRSAGPAASSAGQSGGRAGTQAVAVPVVPALRSDSPIATFDQRFNLPGFGALSQDFSIGSLEGGGEDIPIEEDAGELEPMIDVPFGAAAATAAGVSTMSPASPPIALEGARPDAPSANATPTRTVESRTASFVPAAHMPAGVVAPVSVAALFSAPETPGSDPERAPLAVVARPVASVAAAATPQGSRGATPTLPSAPAAPADFASALQGALSRVEAWMRRDTTAPRDQAPFGATASASAAAAAGFAPVPISEAPPRLNIGRIEVEVVAPPAAPPRSTVQVVTAAASAPRAENLGRLAFGMRQR